MIFVTVGTHEQGLDRLLIELDRLIEDKKIDSEVFAQIGYSEYKPKHYKYKELISYDEMENYMSISDIIITHGGPGSIFQSIQHNKIPIVVPRNPKFNEHVDDHQILFVKRIEKDSKVIGVYDIEMLEFKIMNYHNEESNYNIDNNKKLFISKFSSIIDSKFNIKK